jgi:methylmalonyl-CoA mutase
LNQLKVNRNTSEVKKALINLTNASKSDDKNLLNLAINAARSRATLGEISETVKFIED